jgi:hypothetical protein
MSLSKKGDVTSFQIITIVLAIIGAVIIFLFISSLREGTNSDEEICKISVLTRATVPASTQPFVPLKCNTQKTCISVDGKGCDSNFAGEKNVEQIKVSKENAAEKISEETANAMYECWKMMGEGKLDLFGSYDAERGLDSTEPVCVICKRIVVDESVSDSLNDVRVNDYMDKNKVPGTGLNYFEYFSQGDKVSSYAKFNEESYSNFVKDPSKDIVSFETPPNNKEVAVIFSQVKSTSFGIASGKLGEDVLITGVTGAVTTSFISPGGAKAIGRLVLTRAGLVVGAIVGAGTAGYVALNVYQGRELAAGYCGEFTTTDEDSRKGCSLVQVVPYTIENINNLCNQIDGSP